MQIVQRLFHAQLEIRNNGIIQQFVGGRIQKRNIAADAAQRLNLFVGKIADGNDAVHTGGGQRLIFAIDETQRNDLQLVFITRLFNKIFEV